MQMVVGVEIPKGRLTNSRLEVTEETGGEAGRWVCVCVSEREGESERGGYKEGEIERERWREGGRETIESEAQLGIFKFQENRGKNCNCMHANMKEPRISPERRGEARGQKEGKAWQYPW